jgi:preprotein translocase subunit SecG
MYLCIFLFILVSVLLIMIVLIQKGRGGGLSGAFGGGGGGTTAFGSKTGDVLTWATSIIFGVFLILAVSLNWLADWREGQRMASLQTPAAQTTPANTTTNGADADGQAPAAK